MSGDTPTMASATLPIIPLDRPPDRTVRVPGSKSHTNRALVCAALADGSSVLDGVLFADDTEAMLGALQALGVELSIDRAAKRVTVGGSGWLTDRKDAATAVDVRQSGTTGRFLLPVLALASGHFVLDGDEQLRARPFEQLAEAVGSLGGRIEGTELPLTVNGGGLRGGSVIVSGSVSSQFLSALLLAAPLADSDVIIEVDDELVSMPYVHLTLATMADFGARVVVDGNRFVVQATGYRPADVAIEPDASAASYFFAAAAITGGRITVEGLGEDTIQGDLGFVDVLAAMGATVERSASSTTVRGPSLLRGVEVDMADISDTAQTLAAVAPFASSPTTVTGIDFIRRKETDRIRAVVDQLQNLGIEATEDDDGFTIQPGRPRPGVVHTYDDHRMAMSFALLGLVHPGIVIDNPGCVAKTFPDYFEVLDTLRP